MNLNQVTVPTRDISRSVQFYKTLGLVQIVDSPHYARFECPGGDSTFSTHLADEVSSTDTVIYFEVPDLDEHVARLQTAGIEFDELPADQSWLWREARLRDPDGHRLCLFFAGENRKNPPWRIDA